MVGRTGVLPKDFKRLGHVRALNATGCFAAACMASLLLLLVSWAGCGGKQLCMAACPFKALKQHQEPAAHHAAVERAHCNWSMELQPEQCRPNQPRKTERDEPQF